MLVTPAQKQKVTWFSQQFQFYIKKSENFWQNMDTFDLIMVDTFDLKANSKVWDKFWQMKAI